MIADILVNKLGAKRIGFLTPERRLRQRRAGRDRGRARQARQALREGRRRAVPVQADRLPRRLANVKQAKPDAVVAINAAEVLGHAGADPAVPPGRHRGHLRRRRRHHPADRVQDRRRGMTGVVSADIYFPDLPPFDKIKENLEFVEAYKKAHKEAPDKGAALGAAALEVLGEGGERDQEPRPQDGGRSDPRQDDRRHDLRRPRASRPTARPSTRHTIFKVTRRQDREDRGPEVAAQATTASRRTGLTVRYGALTALERHVVAGRGRRDPGHHRAERRGQELVLRRGHHMPCGATATVCARRRGRHRPADA